MTEPTDPYRTQGTSPPRSMTRPTLVRLIQEATGCSVFEGVEILDQAAREYTPRDRFAAAALAGYRASAHTLAESPDQVARWAYEDADAMLRARAR